MKTQLLIHEKKIDPNFHDFHDLVELFEGFKLTRDSQKKILLVERHEGDYIRFYFFYDKNYKILKIVKEVDAKIVGNKTQRKIFYSKPIWEKLFSK